MIQSTSNWYIKRHSTIEKNNGYKDFTIDWNFSPFSWLAEMMELRKSVNYLSCVEEKEGLIDICCMTQNAALIIALL